MAQVITNAVTNFQKLKYTKQIQGLLKSNLESFNLANTELRSQMPDGNTINYPRPTYLNVIQYTANNTTAYQNLSSSNETLVINDTPMIAFGYDMVDREDQGWDVPANTLSNIAYILREYIDGKFFNQYVNFQLSFNNGVATALTTGNAYTTFADAVAALNNQGIDKNKAVLITDEFVKAKIGEQAVSSRFALGDATFGAGFTGLQVAGAKYYSSNNLTMIGSYTAGVTPADGDLVTINAATFRFKTAIALPGDVLIGASATTAAANLVLAINNGAGAGTNYSDFTDKTRANKLRFISATSSVGTVTFTSLRGYRGTSAFTKASATTTATNKFGQFVLYCIAMEQGAIHLVLRDNVRMETGRIPQSLIMEYLVWSRFGLKVFTEGAERGIIVPIEARAAE